MASEQTRPRFGALTRRGGEVVPLVFHPTDEPDVFLGVRAGDEQPVEFGPGDKLSVDVLGPGQSVAFETTRNLT